MNKIYKLVKVPKSGVISRTIVAGVLASILSFGAIMPVNAASTNSIGEVTAFSKDSNPAGYLLCDGRAVSRTQYAKLFAEIGTKYGAGDGSTTFNLPNLTNRFIEGSTSVGNYIEAGLPNITGSFSGGDIEAIWDLGNSTGAFSVIKENTSNTREGSESDLNTVGVTFDASKSNSIYGKSTTVQPNALTMRYFIKAIDNVDVDDNLHVKGTTQLDKATTIGTSSANANLTVNGNESVSGTITSTGKITSKDGVAAGGKVTGVTAGTADTDALNVKQLKDEVKIADNGNYVKSENTTAGNLTALDQAIGKVANDGAYIKSSETNDVSQNLIVLDDMLKQTRDDGLKFGANSGDDVTNKIGSKVSIIGGGNKADEEYATENLKTIIEKIDGNTQLKIAFDKNPEFSSIKTDGNANIGGALNVTENAHLNSDLQVDGKTNIGGDTTIGSKDANADLTVYGNTNISKNVDIGENLHVKGTTTLDGDTTIGDNDTGAGLTIGKAGLDNGTLTLNGTSNITGDTTIGGDDNGAVLTVGKDGTENGKFVLNGTGDIKGDTTIGNDDNGAVLTVGKDGTENGKFVLNGTGDIKGDTTIGNDNDGATLTVGKEGLDNGKFVLNGDGNVTNTFTVGNGDAGDNLTVNGTTNLYGDTTIGSKDANADLTVHGNSNVSGNGHYGGNLRVDGNANVGGTLTADKVVTNDIQLPGGSLNGRLDEMDTRMDKVGAGAAALAGLHYPGFVPGQKFVMAMGVGNYHGKTASAIGAQYRFNENVAMNVAGTFGNGENMISGGLSFAFGKSKLPRDRENEALKAENKMLLKRLEKLEKWAKNFALIEQKKAAFSDIPNNHWARNAVETLKGNGYVEGYPDGEFKGDKRMSRYEYAQMLYRALSKGASISEEHLKEYEPELRRVQKDYEAEETMREMEARREAQAMASAQQGPKAPEVQPAVQEEPVNAQPVQEAKAEAPAVPEDAPAIAKVPPMEEGMSRYDYARQIFEVLKGGAAIDRSLAMEFEPELKQIIREERAKGTLPQQ